MTPELLAELRNEARKPLKELSSVTRQSIIMCFAQSHPSIIERLNGDSWTRVEETEFLVTSLIYRVVPGYENAISRLVYSKQLAYHRSGKVTLSYSKCDSCNKATNVLIFSTCDHEYGEMRLCKECLLTFLE